MNLRDLKTLLDKHLEEHPNDGNLTLNFADLLLPKTVEIRTYPSEFWAELKQTAGYQEF